MNGGRHAVSHSGILNNARCLGGGNAMPASSAFKANSGGKMANMCYRNAILVLGVFVHVKVHRTASVLPNALHLRMSNT